MPFSEGRTIVGWGVVRLNPWDFDRVYQTREEAEAEAAKMGSEYQVLWGENREGSDEFIFGEPPDDDERLDTYATYLTTEDGDVITTEDGEPIELEGDTQVTADGNIRVTEDGDYRVTADGAVRRTEDGDQPTIAAAALTAAGVGSAQGIGEAVLQGDAWTGVSSRSARLVAVRGELEIAQAAVTYLIDMLADEGGNQGPPLDEHADALESLRQVHRNLGELLDAIDRGVLSDELGDSLAADIARFGGRAVNELRCDPGKYVIAAAAFGLLSACGAADWAGFIGSLALQIPARKAQ